MLIVGFSANNSLTDLLIRYVERGLWHHLHAPLPLATHVWLEREHNGTPGLGIEAVPGGVRQFRATEKDPKRQTIRCYYVPATAEQERVIWNTALAYVARRTRYNMPGLLKACWYVLTGQRKDAFNRDPDAVVFCSALVASCLRAGGIPVEMERPEGGTLIGVPDDDITPARLEVYCAQHFQPVP